MVFDKNIVCRYTLKNYISFRHNLDIFAHTV